MRSRSNFVRGCLGYNFPKLLFLFGLIAVGEFLRYLICSSFDDGKQLFYSSAIISRIRPLEISLANLLPKASCTLGVLLDQLFKAGSDTRRKRDRRRRST